MSAMSRKKVETVPENSRLSERDVRLLLVVCSELVNFCANVTGKIDPAAAAMLAYIRDDIRYESNVKLQSLDKRLLVGWLRNIQT